VVGSAANVAYNGVLLAEEQDVVVVSLKCGSRSNWQTCALTTRYSYRLGVLGFPGVAIPEKNVGLLDQRLAIEWLRDK